MTKRKSCGPLTEAHKEKISASMSGEKNHMFGRTGEAHPNWGIKRDDDYKRKMSEMKKEEAKRKRESGEYVENLKYKNIVVTDPKGNIINVPDDYNAFFAEHDLQGFMVRIRRSVRGHIRKWKLVSYELRHPEKYSNE